MDIVGNAGVFLREREVAAGRRREYAAEVRAEYDAKAMLTSVFPLGGLIRGSTQTRRLLRTTRDNIGNLVRRALVPRIYWAAAARRG